MLGVLSQWIWWLVSVPFAGDSGVGDGGNGDGGEAEETEIPPVSFSLIDPDRCLDLHQHYDGKPDATVHSTFFQRIPPDIRRMVLTAAWGHRSVHVDLRYGLPLAADARLHGRDPTVPPRDKASRTRKWRWYGCECHQLDRRPRIYSTSDDFTYEPTKDTCLDLHSGRMAPLRGEESQKCRVEAMGWLRSCRQAYTEGVEVLYGTNNFIFSGAALLQSIERPLLRPEYLALITSAEILFELGQVARPPVNGMHLSHDKRFSAWYEFLTILNNIPRALPNLRYMHIAPSGYWFPPQMARNDIYRLTEAVIFEPFDAMLQRAFQANPRLEDAYVAIPTAMLTARQVRDCAALQDDSDHRHFSWARLWRPFGSKDGESLSRNEAPGYWVSNGPHNGPRCE